MLHYLPPEMVNKELGQEIERQVHSFVYDHMLTVGPGSLLLNMR